MSVKAQTPYDSFAPETSRPMLTSEALSKERSLQNFSSDTTLCVAMIDRQQERILLVDMSNGSIVAYAPLTDNISHWLSPDPLSDKYPYMSPYVYCANNPMMYVDMYGDSVRLWTETTNFGHTWITTGEGDNMRVYSYGRYDNLKIEKTKCRSLVIEGDGVLLRLSGEDAINYQKDKHETTNPISIVVPDISDTQMQDYFDEIFNSSQELPSKNTGKFYNNPNAHVVDTYNLFRNNCTTTAVKAINSLGSSFFQEISIPSFYNKGGNVNLNKQFWTPQGLSMFLKTKIK